jgi:hypothetical protein
MARKVGSESLTVTTPHQAGKTPAFLRLFCLTVF